MKEKRLSRLQAGRGKAMRKFRRKGRSGRKGTEGPGRLEKK